jgi:redox-sensitive bicupin YhaK (pirin superfamily)
MITLRKSGQRQHHLRGKHESWLVFPSEDAAEPASGGFDGLELISEDRLPPGAAIPARPQHDAEIVTYVREGAVAYQDSMGRSGVIHAGEFQRMTNGRGMRHTETNASRTHGAHVFRIWLRSWHTELESAHEQGRFSTAERRGGLRVVAAPDARRGALRIQADAFLYSSLLDVGQHVAHELAPGRNAWLYVVEGSANLGDLVLETGDSAGISAERAVSLTARKQTEFLLLDLGERAPAAVR